MNRLAAIEARVAALEAAYLHSAERAQSAVRANQPDWARRQDTAKGLYASQLAAALPKLARQVTTTARALRHSRLAHFTVTRAEVRRAQRRIARHGLPTSLTRTLRGFGLASADVRNLTRRLARLPARRAAVRTSPLAGLNPTALNTAARAFAADATRITSLLQTSTAP